MALLIAPTLPPVLSGHGCCRSVDAGVIFLFLYIGISLASSLCEPPSVPAWVVLLPLLMLLSKFVGMVCFEWGGISLVDQTRLWPSRLAAISPQRVCCLSWREAYAPPHYPRKLVFGSHRSQSSSACLLDAEEALQQTTGGGINNDRQQLQPTPNLPPGLPEDYFRAKATGDGDYELCFINNNQELILALRNKGIDKDAT